MDNNSNPSANVFFNHAHYYEEKSKDEQKKPDSIAYSGIYDMYTFMYRLYYL